jgi:predicted dehydrogenase
MKKTRWGILSTAKIGMQKVTPAIQKASLCEVVAIASRDGIKAREAADQLGIPKSYGSYEELLNDKDIDIIYNPLPNHLHVPMTLKALEAGKHVLCEKPIGLDQAEAEFLVNEAKKYPKLKVMEAFMYRFHPQWHKVKELIAEGVIGEVRTVHTFFSYFNPDPNNIRNKADIGGGALMDIGCYCISFPRYIFEKEPVRVIGLIDRDPVMNTDRLTSGMLDFSGGITATFTCSTQLTPYQRTQIVGTKGRIDIELPVNAYPLGAVHVWVVSPDKTDDLVFEASDQYQFQADAFARAVLDDVDVPTPLNDAVANMKVIDAIFESAEKQQWVEVI